MLKIRLIQFKNTNFLKTQNSYQKMGLYSLGDYGFIKKKNIINVKKRKRITRKKKGPILKSIQSLTQMNCFKKLKKNK
jgi:hypothetical protein